MRSWFGSWFNFQFFSTRLDLALLDSNQSSRVETIQVESSQGKKQGNRQNQSHHCLPKWCHLHGGGSHAIMLHSWKHFAAASLHRLGQSVQGDGDKRQIISVSKRVSGRNNASSLRIFAIMCAKLRCSRWQTRSCRQQFLLRSSSWKFLIYRMIVSVQIFLIPTKLPSNRKNNENKM